MEPLEDLPQVPRRLANGARGTLGRHAGVNPQLAALGVTSVSLLRDDQTTAVALEGCAFDADRSAEAAACAVAADPAAVRVLRPIVESALHAASKSQTTRRTK